MDGFIAICQYTNGYRLLLVIMIASLLYQVPLCCFAAVDNKEMMFKEGVVFHEKDWFHRRLVEVGAGPSGDGNSKQVVDLAPSPSPPSSSPSPSSPPPPEPPVPTPEDDPPLVSPPTTTDSTTTNSTTPNSTTTDNATFGSKSSRKGLDIGLVIGLVVAALVFLCVCGFCVFYWIFKSNNIVKPWITGLSGQLQKAFLTGIPKLNRSELESACEEFSNVIGTSSIGKVYKGTLSSGVEIAVISLATETAKNWSKNLTTQFHKKVEALSKINHRNFINMIGYCEEDEPFTRMLVFEYSPNGTLYEHLHFQDSEHLDWAMRLRISMGISYCLEHMHHLKPPAVHKNLCSSAISLSEDYAALVSDFTFWNERGPTEIRSAGAEQMQSSVQSNITSFGKLLFETVTGKGTYLMSIDYIHTWASDYLNNSSKVPDDIVDPTLTSVPSGELIEILKVIQMCLQPETKSRPSMKEVTVMLREITGIGPDQASPKVSPLWWTELEV